MSGFDPALTYTWTSRDSAYNIKITLETDGIAAEDARGKSFEPYTAIRGVQLTPAMTNFGPTTAIRLNRKQLGLAVTIAVRGPHPLADAGRATAYNSWVKSFHATLIDRQLVDQIKFRCGTHVNRWGWIASAYPALRMGALILVLLGIVAAIMTSSWAFAVRCVGGGAVMLMMPKISKPKVSDDLRCVRPYSPDAIPEGCFAKTL